MSVSGADPARRRLAVLASEAQDVGLVGLFTEGGYGPRASARLLTLAANLRAEGRSPGLFMVHFDPRDPARNQRLVIELVERLRARGVREALLDVAWAPELTECLVAAGIATTVLGSDAVRPMQEASLRELPHIELIGVAGGGIENVELTIGQTCSYRAPMQTNEVYEGTDSEHRGCAYCLGARPPARVGPDAAQQLRTQLANYRRELPDLKIVWIPFLETLFETVGTFLDGPDARPLVSGIDLAFQSRPDVLLRERAAIEELAARAHANGTRLRLALVGFENFAPRELAILNRGVTPEQLAKAVELLEAWRAEPPPGLHVRGFVPSFIVFNPWTRFEDLEHTSREIRARGLMNANVERLRIDAEMPLYEKVVAEGLLSTEPVALEVHPNGYTRETAYRFVDARVASASAGFAMLKPLCMSDQAALLEAVLDVVVRSPDPESIDWVGIERGFAELRSVVRGRRRTEARFNSVRVRAVELVLAEHGLALGFPAAEPEPTTMRSGTEGGAEARWSVGDACENRCVPCVWNRRLDLRSDVSLPLSADVRGAQVSIGGREPLARADLPELIAAAKAGGATRVELKTNARRLVRPRHLRALADAGLDVMVVKLFGSDPAAWDEHAHAPGAFAQTLRALALTALAAPEISVHGWVHPGRARGQRLSDFVRLAERLHVPFIRVVIRLANLDLLAISELQAELMALPPWFAVEVEG